MKDMYVVMIQNEAYTDPEVCYKIGSDAVVALYSTTQEASEFIQEMGELGYREEDYFIAKLTRL